MANIVQRDYNSRLPWGHSWGSLSPREQLQVGQEMTMFSGQFEPLRANGTI